MKGVKKGREARNEERVNFVRELFTKNYQARAKRGFIDPPLSCPAAQKEFKARFKVQLNSQRMYDLRRALFAEQGLDDKGKPTGKPKQPALTSANRMEGDPQFHVAVVPIDDEVQGLFLRDALAKLGETGIAPKTLKVDAIHSHYATVSNFPE